MNKAKGDQGMTTKTKQETLCDLAVRCARAELELESLRIQHKCGTLALEGVQRSREWGKEEIARLKRMNARLLVENEVLAHPARYPYDCDGMPSEGLFDWGCALFFLCWATGVATWIAGFIWLCIHLAGRFA